MVGPAHDVGPALAWGFFLLPSFRPRWPLCGVWLPSFLAPVALAVASKKKILRPSRYIRILGPCHAWPRAAIFGEMRSTADDELGGMDGRRMWWVSLTWPHVAVLFSGAPVGATCGLGPRTPEVEAV